MQANMPQSIRILGAPWSVRTDPAPGGNPDNAAHRSAEQCEITLQEGTHPERVRWYLFWGIIKALEQALPSVPGDAGGNIDALDRASAALFTALRDNWQAVMRWFGYGPRSSDIPLTVTEGTLRLLGMTWQLERPRWIPGGTERTLGRCDAQNCTIYVRSDVCDARAAEVALHEVIHACVQEVDEAGDHEPWVSTLSACLAQVIADNPDGIQFIFKEA